MSALPPIEHECDDSIDIDRYQKLLDWSSRYFDRLEALNVNLESKAQQITGFTVGILSIVVPVYVGRIGNDYRDTVWLVQAALTIGVGFITIWLGIGVAAARDVYLPAPDTNKSYFDDFAPEILRGKVCEQLRDELIQLWGEERDGDDREDHYRRGSIGVACHANEKKAKGIKQTARWFGIFIVVLNVGSVASAVIVALLPA